MTKTILVRGRDAHIGRPKNDRCLGRLSKAQGLANRRCQPRSRKTLLDYPQLFRRRPSTAATRVNNFKATDVASVSKVIHTDNQLHAGQFGKAAYTGWIRIIWPPSIQSFFQPAAGTAPPAK